MPGASLSAALFVGKLKNQNFCLKASFMVHIEVYEYFFQHGIRAYIVFTNCICIGIFLYLFVASRVRLKILSVRFEGIFGEENH